MAPAPFENGAGRRKQFAYVSAMLVIEANDQDAFEAAG